MKEAFVIGDLQRLFLFSAQDWIRTSTPFGAGLCQPKPRPLGRGEGWTIQQWLKRNAY
jgi:hypothetical protein